MEVQLEEIINSIKSDGVGRARKEADEIIEQAKEKAHSIIANAEENSREIIRKANGEAEQKAKTVEDSLRQAARDMVLSVRRELENLFYSLLRQEVGETLKGESLERIILSLMKNWSSDKAIDVELSPSDVDELSGVLLDRLKAEISMEDFAIKPLDGMKAGLRISFRDGTAYFDFSDEEISHALLQLLNPKFVSYLS